MSYVSVYTPTFPGTYSVPKIYLLNEEMNEQLDQVASFPASEQNSLRNGQVALSSKSVCFGKDGYIQLPF